MDILTSLAIVILAALIHASFQLSVSVLTLLSGHTLGAKHSRARVLKLTASFVGGAWITTTLLLALTSLIIVSIYGTNAPELVWAIACGLMIGVGLAVWLFYYRRGKGTSLWIPRQVARYLTDRSKATRHSAEAFALGTTTVFAELLFIIAPLFVAALVLTQMGPLWQLVGIVIYAVVSSLPLKAVWVLLSSGQKISRIQQWREKNKYFLQFAAGSGLIVLGVFTYVCKVISEAASGL